MMLLRFFFRLKILSTARFQLVFPSSMLKWFFFFIFFFLYLINGKCFSSLAIIWLDFILQVQHSSNLMYVQPTLSPLIGLFQRPISCFHSLCFHICHQIYAGKWVGSSKECCDEIVTRGKKLSVWSQTTEITLLENWQ